MSWQCPCGCALQLTPADMTNEARLIARLGPTPRHVNLRGGTFTERCVPAAPEPTERGTCRGCGSSMELLAFLASFLKLRGAPWPLCEACKRGRQPDLWEAA